MPRALNEVPNYQATYESQCSQLVATHGRQRAMELVVGDAYDQVGHLEYCAVRQLGLAPEHSIVDVGCGSGRLAVALQRYLKGRYWGTDILADALEHARSRCARPNFQFFQTTRPTIPVRDHSADFVVFFSVFTHLLDEDIFRYLCEARRVAKPTGKIVCSFLDFENEAHWPVFLATVADENPDRILNKLTTCNALTRLARAAGLNVQAIHHGTEKWIEAGEANGGKRSAEFGQSIAILDVFPEESYLALHSDVRAAVTARQFQSGAHHYDTCGHREGRPLR